jgi:chaperonin cofactor prefoldin
MGMFFHACRKDLAAFLNANGRTMKAPHRQLATLFLGMTALMNGVAATTDLKITDVALFSSGVGFFQHEGRVSGNDRAELRFRTEQINDILKSMVVQDLGGGKIGAIGYASRDPIEKTLRSFAVDLTGTPTFGQLLNQLRGEPVEITGPRTLTGRIVGVEKTPVVDPKGEILQQIERLTVLTEEGLQRLELTQLTGIRLTDEKINEELGKALATLASGHDADKKTVELEFEGEGERPVRVAYLLETPIWKTSYRLVLAEGEEPPFLQGWATVDNATEEDWDDVRLTLVSGRPISFRMDLYTPLYVPRPLEELELYTSLRPPDYEGAVAKAPDMERDEARAMQLGTVAQRRSRAAPAPPATMAGEPTAAYEAGRPSMLALREGGVVSAATAEEAGELFAYRIDAPVSIARQRSAMLPIVHQTIEAERLSIYNPATHAKHPLNGLALRNSTGLHLMQGPVTVFDADLYGGDAKLPDLKPGEKRLLAYALDLAREVIVERTSVPDELISLRIAKGTLWHRHKYVDARKYLIKNKGEEPRTFLIEQPYSTEWTLVEPPQPYERTGDLLRFELVAKAGETTSYPVRLERISEEAVSLSSEGVGQIHLYLRSRIISPAVRQALEKVVSLRGQLQNLGRQRKRLEQELREATEEQARVRDNLEALERNTDAYRRQLASFDKLENEIGDKRSRIAQTRDQEAQKRKDLESYLVSLDIE